MKLENEYQPVFIGKLRDLYPGCYILKLNPNYLQGIPDLLFLYERFWAIFEVKRQRPRSSRDFRPNQEFYIAELNQMSLSMCVYPENEAEVLDEIQRQLETRRPTRKIKSK